MSTEKYHICKTSNIYFQYPIQYKSKWKRWELEPDNWQIEIIYCCYCGARLDEEEEK